MAPRPFQSFCGSSGVEWTLRSSDSSEPHSLTDSISELYLALALLESRSPDLRSGRSFNILALFSRAAFHLISSRPDKIPDKAEPVLRPAIVRTLAGGMPSILLPRPPRLPTREEEGRR